MTPDDSTHSRRWLWLSTALLVLPALALWLSALMARLEGSRGGRQASRPPTKAEGETLRASSALVPKPVPDGDNFFAVEPLKDIALVVDGDRDKEAERERKRLATLCFVGRNGRMS